MLRQHPDRAQDGQSRRILAGRVGRERVHASHHRLAELDQRTIEDRLAKALQGTRRGRGQRVGQQPLGQVDPIFSNCLSARATDESFRREDDKGQ